MKRMVLLATAAVVAVLILVPSVAMAQSPSPTAMPVSGGIPSVVLPATALLLGAGVLAYALWQRR